MKPLLLLIFALLFSWQVFGQCSDLKPMFGDKCVKSASVRRADARFIKAEIKLTGSADSAARKYVLMGWQEFFRQDPKTAMKRFNQAWLLNPKSPDVYFAFGHLTRYAFDKNAAEAVKYYRLGRERDQNRQAEPKSLARLLPVLERRNDPDAVIDVSTQLVQGFPEYGKGLGYKQRAYYYIQAQQFDRSIDDSNKALQLDPTNPSIYLNRGYAWSWKRDHQKALADFNKAIALDPGFARAFSNRAILYADSLKQPVQGLADIDKALTLEPKTLEFYRIKTDILFKLNRKQEACTFLRNAIAKGQKGLEPMLKARCGR
ncbi:tetratricopeptide repeat protein [Adhaeribacter soli]|uniref:Tetratricopeptide repeat protein n=1 Tax=Adhaeribacter soli TaxID=2607655 RepID=A0A5N1J3X5_9BACT|nr:tetratricopeptide repeat protein [Adhaeribacter soli]KAA9340795.1 tetratricopeptide repeat protein [Adhaeribacter soli]